MKDRIRLPLNFEAAPLQADLARLEKLDWVAHFVPENYDGEWSVIPLRGPAGAEHPIRMIYSDPTCTEFTDTPFLQDAPAMQAALAAFHCPLQAVRLMKLTPGSKIKEHVDYDLDVAAGFVRMHIPIRTNDGVIFRLNGERVVMNEGECWYLRLSDPHSVENRGSTDRIHMVIDTRPHER